MLLVELAVAVGVFEPHDAVRLLFELLFDLLVRAGRIGDVEPALVVEVGDDRPVDQRRPGGQFDREPSGTLSTGGEAAGSAATGTDQRQSNQEVRRNQAG